jgi:hypothetical protein
MKIDVFVFIIKINSFSFCFFPHHIRKCEDKMKLIPVFFSFFCCGLTYKNWKYVYLLPSVTAATGHWIAAVSVKAKKSPNALLLFAVPGEEN